MSDYGDAEQVARSTLNTLRPPKKLSLSEWADEFYYLSAESSSSAGRWKTLPYQKGILDAITDPEIEQISVMKSSRVGYTKCLNAAVGYFIHHAPCSQMVVQPSVDDAKGYSKEEIATMIRDCPVLNEIVHDDPNAETGPKDSGNTILHKRYPGGVLSMVGANSGAGFRRVSRKVVYFDECDAYPPSAGSDGDQIKLGTRRTETFWDRKIVAGSTPLKSGSSRIEALFNAGDQRRYYVPCPHCGHKDYLVFRESADGGHFMKWDDNPEDAYFVCSLNGCVIEHKDKREMVARGEWRAAAPTKKHASFHVWAAYSFSANASWGQIATEFLESKDNVEKLRTFVNTVLGETFVEKGDAPEWQRIYNRREAYEIGTVPTGVLFLTAGVDVQKDRVVYEVVGWGEARQSWSIDAGVIMFDTSNEAEWVKLDELLNRSFPTEAGGLLNIMTLAVDSGAFTQLVYNWASRHPLSRVIAVKGQSGAKSLIGSPSSVEINFNGKRMSRGYKVWPVGVDLAKSEIYSWLGLPLPEEGQSFPNGFCHFPEHDEDFFKQLTAEQLISSVTKEGFTKLTWTKIPGRENHQLDCRVYARAAAARAGLDRYARKAVPQTALAATTTLKSQDVDAQTTPARTTKPRPKSHDSSFLGNRARDWLIKKR